MVVGRGWEGKLVVLQGRGYGPLGCTERLVGKGTREREGGRETNQRELNLYYEGSKPDIKIIGVFRYPRIKGRVKQKKV